MSNSYVFVDRRQPKLTLTVAPIEDVRRFRSVYRKIYRLEAYTVPIFVATKRSKVDTEDVRGYLSDIYNWVKTKVQIMVSPKPSLSDLIDPVAEPGAEPEPFDESFDTNDTVEEPLTVENLMPQRSHAIPYELQMPADDFTKQLADNLQKLDITMLDASNILCDEGTSTWYNFRALTEKWLPAITVMKEEDVYSAIVRFNVNGIRRITVMTYDDVVYIYKNADFFNDVSVEDVVMIPSRTALSPKILSFYDEDSIEDDSYFLRFTYDIRKLAGYAPKPAKCKNRVAKKIMEYMYNHYEFDADLNAQIAYGDVFDEIAQHGSYENVAEVLGWLGYMIKAGKVLHLRRRAGVKHVVMVEDEYKFDDRTGKQLQHKVLALKYTSGFRNPCEVPFNKQTSPFNMCSL